MPPKYKDFIKVAKEQMHASIEKAIGKMYADAYLDAHTPNTTYVYETHTTIQVSGQIDTIQPNVPIQLSDQAPVIEAKRKPIPPEPKVEIVRQPAKEPNKLDRFAKIVQEEDNGTPNN